MLGTNRNEGCKMLRLVYRKAQGKVTVKEEGVQDIRADGTKNADGPVGGMAQAPTLDRRGGSRDCREDEQAYRHVLRKWKE